MIPEPKNACAIDVTSVLYTSTMQIGPFTHWPAPLPIVVHVILLATS